MVIDGRKLLVIFGQAAGTSFAIVPGWYVGNEKYEDDQLTAVDVELVEPVEQPSVERLVRESLDKRGQHNIRISFWGARGFSQSTDFPPASSSMTPTREQENEKKQKKTILIVDDDPGIRRIVKMFLEREGYAVRTASSTGEALDILKIESKEERESGENFPSLMLLDIMMPGATGWQLLRELENDPKVNTLPVIAISGLEKPSKTQHEFDSKMLYDYLVKPFSMEELLRAVRKFSQ